MTMDSWMADGYIEYPGRDEPPTACNLLHSEEIPGVRLPVVFICQLANTHDGKCRGMNSRHPAHIREWSKSDGTISFLQPTCNDVNRDLGASCSRPSGHDGQHSGRRRGRGRVVTWESR